MTKPYNDPVNFGKYCLIKYAHKFVIGRGSTYNDRCWFNARAGITIGENTLIGPNVLMQSSNHKIKNINIEQNANDKNSWCKDASISRVSGRKITIGDDVWIGANCIILPGVVIPNKCIIGAGTLLTKSNSKCLEEGDIVANDTKLRKIGNRKDYD